MEVIILNKEEESQYYEVLFKDYPDIIKVDTLKKFYKLLKEKKIYSKRIGRDYYIPKISIINYLMKK